MRTRKREVDCHVGHDASRPRRHDQHAGGQEHRFGERVGDEQPGEALDAEQPQHLAVESLARHLVECSEGLVEEEHLGMQDQRAGQRHPHAHAARQLLRPLALVTAEADELDRLLHQRIATRPRHSPQLRQQPDVRLDGAPRQQRRVLEHVTQRGAVDLDAPGCRLGEARGDAEQDRLRRQHERDLKLVLAGLLLDVEAEVDAVLLDRQLRRNRRVLGVRLPALDRPLHELDDGRAVLQKIRALTEH